MTENRVTEEKTIGELKAEHASKTARIMVGYLDATERIRQEAQPDEGRYLDRLSDQERMKLLYEQKSAKADEAYREAFDAYATQTEAFRQEHEARVKALSQRLFGVANADAAARAATASESELASMLDYAALAGNKDLAKAAFVAAHTRGAGHLVGRYFDEAAPDARDLYQEYSQRLPQEVLERQGDVGRVVQKPDLDRLMPPLRAGGA
jgi:hypothetical protein